uniref:Uncharacterized protein n=1 Tax=Poecilia reticulata TaxID=8081 RepID=A0A3P9P470_POERE
GMIPLPKHHKVNVTEEIKHANISYLKAVLFKHKCNQSLLCLVIIHFKHYVKLALIYKQRSKPQTYESKYSSNSLISNWFFIYLLL